MRKINELIWHCTATPQGRKTTVAEIDSWHKQRGWNGIGYHKVVHLDGTVSDGRPISKIGAHVKGKNTGTIGYVYVGGTDKAGKAKDTRTAAQKATMRRLTLEAIREYGLTKVTGHNQYANKACPCFDAQAEYADLLTMKNGMPNKDPAKLTSSRTLKGSAASGVGVLGTTATDAAAQLQPLVEISGYLKFAFIALTLVGLAFVVYAKLDDSGAFTEKKPK
ncbi:N-acetylmuramoyl-L-alanine amidase [Maritalea porphyrae]|uniref:N-acetylmuramoyl-L-alanine amidase n=1 Tax=Maritalea porphyrae TaxID=880732 RepID=UPI0022AFE987|nr:N-acetylmuramoyl-L-alanine amidase [Maritalea porphyrae]MCZ4270875.1 N-acetylmuramoyl-L-alanine amidase [Maritalea porphyrae]